MSDMDLDFEFDATEIEPSAPIEVLPPGSYTVQISQAEKRPTRDGSGSYLWMEMDIIDGPYAGRKVWDRLNIWNKNETASSIAKQSLSAICRAVKEPRIKSFVSLMHKPLVAVLRVKPAGPDKQGVQRDAANEVKGYLPSNATASAGARPAPRPVTAAETGAPSKPAAMASWARRPA